MLFHTNSIFLLGYEADATIVFATTDKSLKHKVRNTIFFPPPNILHCARHSSPKLAHFIFTEYDVSELYETLHLVHKLVVINLKY